MSWCVHDCVQRWRIDGDVDVDDLNSNDVVQADVADGDDAWDQLLGAGAWFVVQSNLANVDVVVAVAAVGVDCDDVGVATANENLKTKSVELHLSIVAFRCSR